MEKETKKTEQKSAFSGKKIVVLVGVLVILIIAAVVIWKMQQPKNQPDPVTSGETTDVTMMEIETPYGTLKYPSTYEDVLVCEETKEGDAVIEAFYSNVFEEKVELFTVYFQKPEEGTMIGYIEKEDEKIAVSIEVSEQEPPADGTDSQKEKHSLMIDGVNDVIVSLASFEGYVEE